MSWIASGPSYAVLTAVSWAVAVVLFRKAGDEVPPVALNLFKNAVGLALLACTFPLVGEPATQGASGHDVLFLLVSGALGIGVADTLFFHSLNLLGASRSAIVDCLYSPMVVLFSFALLGERLTPLATLGAGLVLAAILLAEERGGRDALQHRPFVMGALLGAASMALMSLSIVAVKPVLERHSVLWATSMRLIGGLGILVVAGIGSPRSRRSMLAAFRPGRIWRFSLPAAVVGSYVALLLWIAGFKHTQAGTAAILNQTSTLFVVVLAALFLREPLTGRKVAAVALGLTGSLLALA